MIGAGSALIQVSRANPDKSCTE